MIIRRYIFYCPECRKEYARSLSPLRLGSGLRRCPHCTAVNIVTLIIVIPQMSDGAERNSTLGVVALLMLLPWVPYFLKRQKAIKDSVARFAKRTALQEGVEIILPE
jgi:hypothetical protein